MITYKNGRIYANDGVDTPTSGVNEFLHEKHTTEEILSFLNGRKSSQYDADNSKEFSATEIEDYKTSSRNPVTIFDRKELQRIKKAMDEIDEQISNNENK